VTDQQRQAAKIMNFLLILVMCEVHDKISSEEARIIGSIHDEILDHGKDRFRAIVSRAGKGGGENPIVPW